VGSIEQVGAWATRPLLSPSVARKRKLPFEGERGGLPHDHPQPRLFELHPFPPQLLRLRAGFGAKDGTEVRSAPAAVQPDFSYADRVSGKTIEKGTTNSRPLDATIILVREGDAYTATFDLQTELPTLQGPSACAQVVGKGDGMVKGAGLEGTATTQIVWATLPGVDSGSSPSASARASHPSPGRGFSPTDRF
jgi:hypothetical protein